MKNQPPDGMKHISKIAKAKDFRDQREPALRIGDIVKLNSGSPRMLIVDFDPNGLATIAWRALDGSAVEAEIPVACVHRISPV